MARLRERLLLPEESRRRTQGTGAVGCAGLGFLFAAAMIVVLLLNDAGPVPGELRRPFLGFVAFLLIVLLAGLRVRLRPRHFVDVDVAAGTATIVRGKEGPRRLPLREAGPLRHVVEERQVRSGKSWRTAWFHVVRPCGIPGLVVHESEDELKARRAAESRARAWGVPYVLPSGETRAPEELDVPLYQRLGGDEEAMRPLPPPSPSSLSVEWRDEGYVISTTFRPKVDWGMLVMKVLLPLAAMVWGGWQVLAMLQPRERAGRDDPVAEVVFPVLAVVALAALLRLIVPGLADGLRIWRRTSHPPTIRVSAEGVRYRGRTIPLRAIEEVEPARGAACRLVSDERLLVIDADFCDGPERDWLRHELRRLVIEAGQQLPAA